MRHAVICVIVVALCALVGCRPGDKGAASESPSAAAEAAASAQETAPVWTPPPGEPGPFLLQIDSNLPTQVFGTVATPSHFAIAIQSDVRDIQSCPSTELAVCFKGSAYIAERTNPNQPKLVPLYESDTQSGARVDGMAAAAGLFAFAFNEGAYAGDTRVAAIVVANPQGDIVRQIPLQSDQNTVLQTSLASYDDSAILACSLMQRAKRTGIVCDIYDLAKNTQKPAGVEWFFEAPIRSLDIAVHDKHVLLAWTAAGHTYAAFAQHPENIFDLGESTAQRPIIAAGHGAFAVVWQDANADTCIERIDPRTREAKRIKLNGLRERTINGIAAISSGFLIAFRFDNAPQLAIIEPGFSNWHLVDNNKRWRMISDDAVLDLQDAHSGKILWQTAHSLIAERP